VGVLRGGSWNNNNNNVRSANRNDNDPSNTNNNNGFRCARLLPTYDFYGQNTMGYVNLSRVPGK